MHRHPLFSTGNRQNNARRLVRCCGVGDLLGYQSHDVGEGSRHPRLLRIWEPEASLGCCLGLIAFDSAAVVRV